MDEVVFTPVYSKKFLFEVGFLILLEPFFLIYLLLSKEPTLIDIILFLFFALLIVLVLPTFIKRIVFSETSFRVEKYLWSARTFEYTDVLDIGSSMIKIRRGNIVLSQMLNSNELHKILQKLVNKGKIDEGQLENKLDLQESSMNLARLVALILSAILGWFIPYFIPMRSESKREIFSFLLSLSLVVFSYRLIYFIKSRRRRQ